MALLGGFTRLESDFNLRVPKGRCQAEMVVGRFSESAINWVQQLREGQKLRQFQVVGPLHYTSRDFQGEKVRHSCSSLDAQAALRSRQPTQNSAYVGRRGARRFVGKRKRNAGWVYQGFCFPRFPGNSYP